MMNPETGAIADFTDLALRHEDSAATLFHARDAAGNPCRLTLFSADISAKAGFRAAWRHDADLLRTLHHECLPSRVATGEHDGRVHFSTELPAGLPLDRFLETSSLSWDEVADVGWQTASIVQHLHNSGLTHGRLNGTSVLITDSVRVILVDTGIVRWIQAASEPHEAADFMACCERDLVDLGRLLRQLTESMQTTVDRPPEPTLAAWKQLIADLSDPVAAAFPSSAREVQGRLGGLLLDEAGDSIDVVDDRAGMVRRGRSIVHELFDSSDDTDQPVLQDKKMAGSPAVFRFMFAAMVLAAIITIVAFIVWNL